MSNPIYDGIRLMPENPIVPGTGTADGAVPCRYHVPEWDKVEPQDLTRIQDAVHNINHVRT